MRPSTIIPATVWRVGIVFFSKALSADEKIVGAWRHKCLTENVDTVLAGTVRNRSCSGVTSNDSSVKGNDMRGCLSGDDEHGMSASSGLYRRPRRAGAESVVAR
jgi:hypothetical protein